MPTSSQNYGNRGSIRQNMRLSGENPRRTATRLTQTIPEEAKKGSAEERSPLLLLARRIREEQGTEGLGAFLRAMEPFAAPYELKKLAAQFGMEHHQSGGNGFGSASGGFSSVGDRNGFNMNGANANGMNAPQGTNAQGFGAPGAGTQQNAGAGMGFDPNTIRMMQMMNGMGNINGGNGGTGSMSGSSNGMGNMGSMMQLMQLMRMLPMLQNMGKSGGDISQIMKMMNM